MEAFIPALFMWVVFAVSVAFDSRKVRCGVYLVVALSLTALPLLGYLTQAFQYLLPGIDVGAWIVLGVAVIALGAIIALGVMLILNGIDMWRKEGRSLANSLSLILGLLMVGYVAGYFLAAFAQLYPLIAVMSFLGLPLAYLGFGLVSYLVYSVVYKTWHNRFGRRADTVIVLGAGLRRDGSVTPLLASRVDLGIAWWKRQQVKGPKPRFVVSGGKGSDELRSEAAAMTEYAVAQGMDAADIIQEDQSTSTRENIIFSGKLLTETAPIMRAAAVTNDFHAFRAALLMRSVGMPGYGIGAKTATYYRPSATLREYVAILNDHRGVNLLALGLAFLPLAFVVASVIFGWN